MFLKVALLTVFSFTPFSASDSSLEKTATQTSGSSQSASLITEGSTSSDSEGKPPVEEGQENEDAFPNTYTLPEDQETSYRTWSDTATPEIEDHVIYDAKHSETDPNIYYARELPLRVVLTALDKERALHHYTVTYKSAQYTYKGKSDPLYEIDPEAYTIGPTEAEAEVPSGESLPEGRYSLTARAVDWEGGYTEEQFDEKIIYDKSPPEASIGINKSTTSGGDASVKTSDYIKAHCPAEDELEGEAGTDEVSGVKQCLLTWTKGEQSGTIGTLKPKEGSKEITPEQYLKWDYPKTNDKAGTYKIRADLEDQAGNKKAWTQDTTVAQGTGPTVTDVDYVDSNDQAYVQQGEEVEFTWTVKDNSARDDTIDVCLEEDGLNVDCDLIEATSEGETYKVKFTVVAGNSAIPSSEQGAQYCLYANDTYGEGGRCTYLAYSEDDDEDEEVPNCRTEDYDPREPYEQLIDYSEDTNYSTGTAESLGADKGYIDGFTSNTDYEYYWDVDGDGEGEDDSLAYFYEWDIEGPDYYSLTIDDPTTVTLYNLGYDPNGYSTAATSIAVYKNGTAVDGSWTDLTQTTVYLDGEDEEGKIVIAVSTMYWDLTFNFGAPYTLSIDEECPNQKPATSATTSTTRTLSPTSHAAKGSSFFAQPNLKLSSKPTTTKQLKSKSKPKNKKKSKRSKTKRKSKPKSRKSTA